MEEIQKHVKICLSKYADFNGRASLPEFWWFVLALSVSGAVLNLVLPFLGMIFSLGLMLPAVAACARRLHDTGKSGWLQLVGLVPLVGWAALIYWAIQPGDLNVNMYGAPPEDDTSPISSSNK